MAASGFTPISLYYSTTAAAEPTAGNLVSGELAINIADGKLFYKNSSGNVRLLSIGYGSSTVTPTNGGVQYGTGSALALTAAGSSGQILRSNGAAAPTWADLSSLGVNTISFGSTGLTPSTATSGAVTVAGTLITSNGGTGLSSYTLGDMVYYSAGTTLTKLTIGAANRVMTSSGSAPQWVDSLTGLSSVSSTAFTENSYPVVSQSDIGTAPNEIPLNQYLGSMAYQDGDTSDITVYGVRVGRGAGAVSTNTAVGAGALAANTTGASNTAVGYQAGYNNTTSNQSTLIGAFAGGSLTGGANTCFGYNTGGSTAGVAYGLFVGYGAIASGATAQEMVICTTQSTATGKGSNTGFITPNGGGVYQGNNSASWSTTSDRRLKKNIVDNTIGLDAITSIRVRNFEYRLPEEVEAELKPTDAVKKSGVQLGVIAQELNEVLPDCVKIESTGVMSVDPDNLTWYMVNAIKELKSELDTVKAELAALKGA